MTLKEKVNLLKILGLYNGSNSDNLTKTNIVRHIEKNKEKNDIINYISYKLGYCISSFINRKEEEKLIKIINKNEKKQDVIIKNINKIFNRKHVKLFVPNFKLNIKSLLRGLKDNENLF